MLPTDFNKKNFESHEFLTVSEEKDWVQWVNSKFHIHKAVGCEISIHNHRLFLLYGTTPNRVLHCSTEPSKTITMVPCFRHQGTRVHRLPMGLTGTPHCWNNNSQSACCRTISTRAHLLNSQFYLRVSSKVTYVCFCVLWVVYDYFCNTNFRQLW